MSRHPSEIMVQLTARVPRGQQGFWEIIRGLHRHKKTWTFSEVDQRSNVSTSTVHDFLRRLLKAGFIVEAGRTAKTTLYRLAKDQPNAPCLKRDGSPGKSPGRGQDQMWRSMKMLPRFTARDLAAHSTTPETAVTLETAKSYIKHLLHAGYLVVLSPMTGSGPRRCRAVYKLLRPMNTGPLAPQIQSTDFVFDPNLKVVMGPEAVEATKAGGK